MKKFIMIFALIVAPLTVSAESVRYYQNNVSIKKLGNHGGHVFLMNLEEDLATDCEWDLVYCPETDSHCENAYSIVLAAKMSGTKLSEFWYDQNPESKMCTVALISIE